MNTPTANSGYNSYICSLCAVSPVSNLLADLPMPHPTSMSYGLEGLSAPPGEGQEISKQLSKTIFDAMHSVDNSWLKIKSKFDLCHSPLEAAHPHPKILRSLIRDKLLTPTVSVTKLRHNEIDPLPMPMRNTNSEDRSTHNNSSRNKNDDDAFQTASNNSKRVHRSERRDVPASIAQLVPLEHVADSTTNKENVIEGVECLTTKSKQKRKRITSASCISPNMQTSIITENTAISTSISNMSTPQKVQAHNNNNNNNYNNNNNNNNYNNYNNNNNNNSNNRYYNNSKNNSNTIKNINCVDKSPSTKILTGSDILQLNIRIDKLDVSSLPGSAEKLSKQHSSKDLPIPSKIIKKAKNRIKSISEPETSAELCRDARVSEELIKAQAINNFKSLLERVQDLENRFAQLKTELSAEDLKSECLMSHLFIEQMCTEAWKLSRAGLMREMYNPDLQATLFCMQRHIQDCVHIDLWAVPSVSGSPLEAKMWRALSIERIIRGVEACQVILAIACSTGLGASMVIEETIDSVLEHTRFQLVTNIYPEMDASYRVAELNITDASHEVSNGSFTIPTSGHAKNKFNKHSKTPLQTSRKFNPNSISKWDLYPLYSKLSEQLESLSLLVEKSSLTDSLVLKLSSLALKPFFVEHNSKLQLSALKLARNIFYKYSKHRQLMLDEVFLSLAKLPSNKRNLRTYYLDTSSYLASTGAGEQDKKCCIQMVTALVMQLFQCMISPDQSDSNRSNSTLGDKDHSSLSNVEQQLLNNMEEVKKTAHSFLSTLLKKCYATISKYECDLRPVFESFQQDLLTTFMLSEWPVSIVLLNVLCRLYLVMFSNQQADHPLRLASAEHAGCVISYVRTHSLQYNKSLTNNNSNVKLSPHQAKSNTLQTLISNTPAELKEAVQSRDEHSMDVCGLAETDDTRAILSALFIGHLREKQEADSSVINAIHFWLAQWIAHSFKDGVEESKNMPLEFDELLKQDGTTNSAHYRNLCCRLMSERDIVISKHSIKLSHFDVDNIIHYFIDNDPLIENFTIFLNQLILLLNENNVQLRTKAMKSISCIFSADPSLIISNDLKNWIKSRMCDMSSMVRESTVELIGRCLQEAPSLASEYYEILSHRMLDTSVAVRKRVIRILRHSISRKMDTQLLVDMCVKLICRIDDEESIQQLILSIFADMWFSSLKSTASSSEKHDELLFRCNTISEVVFSLHQPTAFSMLEELFAKLLNSDHNTNSDKMSVMSELIDTFMESLLQLDEVGSSLAKMSPIICSLHIFSRINGSLLAPHITALQPYLSMNCSTHGDQIGLSHLLKTLSYALPHLNHSKPGPEFLAATEEQLLKIAMQKGTKLIEASLSCLEPMINEVTHNYKIITDCFIKFYEYLEKGKELTESKSATINTNNLKYSLMRGLFTIGLLCRHFNINEYLQKLDTSTTPVQFHSSSIFSIFLFFATGVDDLEIREKAIIGLGYFFLRYSEMILDERSVELYDTCLTDGSVLMKCQVLTNLKNHLEEDEARLKRADTEWHSGLNVNCQRESNTLQDMGDKQSTLSSTMIQTYLCTIMRVYFTVDTNVRLHILNLLSLILRQGLIYPAQCIPCLVAMTTDPEERIRIKGVEMLEEINKTGKLMNAQLIKGVRQSYEFLNLLNNIKSSDSNNDNNDNNSNISSGPLTRGRSDNNESRLAAIYLLVRGTKSLRRAFILTLLRYFDDIDKNDIRMLLFIADNLSNFSYTVLDEVLYLVNCISVTLSLAGPNLIESFQDALGTKQAQSGISQPEGGSAVEPNEAILCCTDLERLLSVENCNIKLLCSCVYKSYAILLLLHLSNYLKQEYSLPEHKCHEYSASAHAKFYDKPVPRKNSSNLFEPSEVVEALELGHDTKPHLRSRRELTSSYLDFFRQYRKLEVDGMEYLPEVYPDQSNHISEMQLPPNTAPQENISTPSNNSTNNFYMGAKESKSRKKFKTKIQKTEKTKNLTDKHLTAEKRSSVRQTKKLNYFESDDAADMSDD